MKPSTNDTLASRVFKGMERREKDRRKILVDIGFADRRKGQRRKEK